MRLQNRYVIALQNRHNGIINGTYCVSTSQHLIDINCRLRVYCGLTIITTGSCDSIHTFEVLKTLYLSVKVNILLEVQVTSVLKLTGSGLTKPARREILMSSIRRQLE